MKITHKKMKGILPPWPPWSACGNESDLRRQTNLPPSLLTFVYAGGKILT